MCQAVLITAISRAKVRPFLINSSTEGSLQTRKYKNMSRRINLLLTLVLITLTLIVVEALPSPYPMEHQDPSTKRKAAQAPPELTEDEMFDKFNLIINQTLSDVQWIKDTHGTGRSTRDGLTREDLEAKQKKAPRSS